MPGRCVAHVDQVQTGLDIRRHSAVEEVYDDLTSGSGLDIALANRRAWIDDYDRQVFLFVEPKGFLLGEELAALIVADHVDERYRGVFVSRRAIRRNAERANSACVYDLLGAHLE